MFQVQGAQWADLERVTGGSVTASVLVWFHCMVAVLKKEQEWEMQYKLKSRFRMYSILLVNILLTKANSRLIG